MPSNGKYVLVDSSTESTFLSETVAHCDPVSYLQCIGDETRRADKSMVIESAWPLMVNGEHWLTILCTPVKLRYFVLGFLYNEGLIASVDDLLDLHIGRAPEEVIRVELRDRDLSLPQRRTLTSGCGGGITFVDLAVARDVVHSSLQVTPRQIREQMLEMKATVDDDHRGIGGFHTSALSNGEELLVIASDIGRHNTLDKVAGECLSRGISMRDAILLTTGRVSVEMLGKAARMQVPMVASLNSPTYLSAELAQEWGITLIGYVRGNKMQIYTGWQRILSQDGLFIHDTLGRNGTGPVAGSNGKERI